MQEINLEPLFKYLGEIKDELKSDICRIEDKVDILQTSVDGLAKLVQDFRDEHIILHKRLEVLEEWAKEVSKKFNIPLPF